MVIILVFGAWIIVLSTFCISLFVDSRRWRRDYERDIKLKSARYGSELRKMKDEISNYDLENAQLKERIEKLEITVSGYRNLVTEVHKELSDSAKLDHRSLLNELRELRTRLMLFAKHDDTLQDMPVSEQRRFDFMGHLMATYPEVTEASAQLAYLVATNTPVQTICQVLNINAKSVQMARFRLRKKMGLQPEDSLEESLNVFLRS